MIVGIIMAVELVIKKDLEPATIIFSQVLERTARNTQENYFAKFKQWFRVYERNIAPDQAFNMLDFLQYKLQDLLQKRANGSLMHSSIRQYKAVLNFGIACVTAVIEDKKEIVPLAQKEFWLKYAKNVPYLDLHELAKSVLTISDEPTEVLKYLNKQAAEKNQTSTQKLKYLPNDIYQIIVNDRNKSRKLLRDFVFFNCIFGLRPVEWLYSNLNVGNKSDDGLLDCCLVVKNAKNTHGRACGDKRRIHFTETSEFVDALCSFMSDLEKEDRACYQKSGVRFALKNNGENEGVFSDTHYTGVFEVLQQQLNRLMRRDDCNVILRKIYTAKRNSQKYHLGKSQSKEKGKNVAVVTMQYPTLYSTRHQAIANCKQAGYDSVQIAALFGHISPYTADKHYARKQKGNGTGTKLRPDRENMQIILDNKAKLRAISEKYIGSPENQSPTPIGQHKPSSKSNSFSM